MRAFGTEAFVKAMAPEMMVHPHVMLSGIGSVTCTWLDMLAKIPGESTRTRLVRDETLVMLRLRLQSFTREHAVSTLLVMLHLLGGDMWSCDEPTVRCHERGIEQMIHLCGDLEKTGRAMIAQFTTA